MRGEPEEEATEEVEAREFLVRSFVIVYSTSRRPLLAQGLVRPRLTNTHGQWRQTSAFDKLTYFAAHRDD